ncbi:hypothetical protein [Leptolyngbya sp. KIOST-1]|uniref:hypothetical protein n=1 Tax=Leptolyngbya sp. KIOST-1 TaxID=1229172 RepID=UPI000691C6EE|nr:hypothetical protein [Leptolyngbya sp. KIOST-1]
MHSPSYSGQVLTTLARDQRLSQLSTVVGVPQGSLVVSPFALRRALDTALAQPIGQAAVPPALIIWAFSAGCVGAAALAAHWQRHRGPVLALFLVDGWGVPRDVAIPTHRLSHDRFTHYTSRWLGAGDDDFCAEPAVPHLTLWRQPQAVMGWVTGTGQTAADQPSQKLTAADFLCQRSQAALGRYRASGIV